MYNVIANHLSNLSKKGSVVTFGVPNFIKTLPAKFTRIGVGPTNFKPAKPFDYAYVFDVLQYCENYYKTLEALKSICKKLIIVVPDHKSVYSTLSIHNLGRSTDQFMNYRFIRCNHHLMGDPLDIHGNRKTQVWFELLAFRNKPIFDALFPGYKPTYVEPIIINGLPYIYAELDIVEECTVSDLDTKYRKQLKPTVEQLSDTENLPFLDALSDLFDVKDSPVPNLTISYSISHSDIRLVDSLLRYILTSCSKNGTISFIDIDKIKHAEQVCKVVLENGSIEDYWKHTSLVFTGWTFTYKVLMEVLLMQDGLARVKKSYERKHNDMYLVEVVIEC